VSGATFEISIDLLLFLDESDGVTEADADKINAGRQFADANFLAAAYGGCLY
jgi:hypothetical protein